jgi:hypothetical protein
MQHHVEYLRIDLLKKNQQTQIFRNLIGKSPFDEGMKKFEYFGRVKPSKLVSLLSYQDVMTILNSRKVSDLKNKWQHGVIYVYANRESNLKNIKFQLEKIKELFLPILGEKLKVHVRHAFSEKIKIALFKT